MIAEVEVPFAHGAVKLKVAGAGPTIVILPRETGAIWSDLHDRLSRSMRVVAPILPGYDGAPRPDWLRNVTDLSALVGLALDTVCTERAAFLGLGFGGWVAASLAARSPERVGQLILHAPMGIKPDEGEIVDQFLFAPITYLQMGFMREDSLDRFYPEGVDANFENWWTNREMTTRLAWKPYMYDPGLRHLLGGIHIPTLVTWSRDDRIVPPSCARLYAEAIQGARLLELSGGHRADLEEPELMADMVLQQLHSTGFLRSAASTASHAV